MRSRGAAWEGIATIASHFPPQRSALEISLPQLRRLGLLPGFGRPAYQWGGARAGYAAGTRSPIREAGEPGTRNAVPQRGEQRACSIRSPALAKITGS
jgi:hypothetical protein